MRRLLRATPAPRQGGVAAQDVAEHPAAHAPFRATLAELLHPRGLLTLMLAYMGFGCGYIIYFTFFIALVVQQGVPALLAGLVWSAIGIVGVAGGIMWGRAIDRRPTGFTLAAALALGALGALGVGGPIMDGIGAILMGFAFIGVPAMVTALLRHAVHGARYTAGLSIGTAFVSVGQMLGPIIEGAIVGARGLAAGTAAAAIFLAGGAMLATAYGLIQRGQAPS